MYYTIKGETLTATADAIREKNPNVDTLTPEEFPDAVRSIPMPEPPKLQHITVGKNGLYAPDEGYDGISKINVQVVVPGKPILFTPTIDIRDGIVYITDGGNGAFDIKNILYLDNIEVAVASEQTFNITDYLTEFRYVDVKVKTVCEHFNDSQFSNIINWYYINPSGTQYIYYTIDDDKGYAICNGFNSGGIPPYGENQDALQHPIIASKYNGYDVTVIGQNAFKDEENIVSVTIPNTITNMYDGCFNNCDQLQYVIFGDNPRIKNLQGFQNCGGLESFTVPYCVTGLGSNCFSNCKNLKIVDCLGKIQSIAIYALFSSNNLRRLDLSRCVEVPTLAGAGLPNVVDDIYLQIKVRLSRALF